MSNIQTGAERMPHDLSHLGFLAGQIGRLITISTTPVIAGDSFEMDAVGALRLSPLRRGLAIDSTVDIFTFYVPHRHVYGEQWIKFMKDGVNATPLPTVNTTLLRHGSDKTLQVGYANHFYRSAHKFEQICRHRLRRQNVGYSNFSQPQSHLSFCVLLQYLVERRALHTKRQNLFQELDAVIHLLMEAKHWGLRKSRNATSLNSRFKSLDTLKVKIISVTFRRVIRTNHKKASKIWRHENIQLGGCQS